MNNLFPFRLRAGFASARVHSVQSVRYEYVPFLNLELKSDFHFLYLAKIVTKLPNILLFQFS